MASVLKWSRDIYPDDQLNVKKYNLWKNNLYPGRLSVCLTNILIFIEFLFCCSKIAYCEPASEPDCSLESSVEHYLHDGMIKTISLALPLISSLQVKIDLARIKGQIVKTGHIIEVSSILTLNDGSNCRTRRRRRHGIMHPGNAANAEGQKYLSYSLISR